MPERDDSKIGRPRRTVLESPTEITAGDARVPDRSGTHVSVPAF